jgi:hypothetical protein
MLDTSVDLVVEKYFSSSEMVSITHNVTQDES